MARYLVRQSGNPSSWRVIDGAYTPFQAAVKYLKDFGHSQPVQLTVETISEAQSFHMEPSISWLQRDLEKEERE